jgi:hypothetical protein
MRRRVVSAAVLAAAICLTNSLAAEPPRGVCGTPDIPPDLLQAINQLTTELRPNRLKSGEVQMPIAFHNVYSGKLGKVTDSQIYALVNNLNVGFQGTPFSFFLSRIDRTNNKAWYSNCGIRSKNEQKLKKRLARDPRTTLNIYSCVPTAPNLPPGQILVGFAYLPFMTAESSYMHGVILHPAVLPGGTSSDYGTYGLIGIHEVGHYLGLFHTFQGGCEGTGDAVADTPAQLEPHFSCPIGIDTCPDSQGPDDTTNFMNYSNDQCMSHFTPGQTNVMTVATQVYKPSLWQ